MIEEASESDSDPSDFDPEDFDPSTIIRPSQAASTSRPTPHEELKPQFKAPSTSIADQEKYKTWQCLYPVYFDINRSRAEGRRVGKELAVENPLARELADAVQFIGFNVVFEPAKMHPKDWANPGRVKLQFKDGGKVQHTHVTNSQCTPRLLADESQPAGRSI
jgi:signal recognition particle subunit SRP19